MTGRPSPQRMPSTTLVEHTLEKTLDEALDETFPASDPLALTPRRAGLADKARSEKDTHKRTDERAGSSLLPPSSPPPHIRRTWN